MRGRRYTIVSNSHGMFARKFIDEHMTPENTSCEETLRKAVIAFVDTELRWLGWRPSGWGRAGLVTKTLELVKEAVE